MNKKVATAAALGAGALYGLGGTINQIFVSFGFSVVPMTVAQYAMGVVILGIYVLIRHRGPVTGKDLRGLIVLGALMSISTVTYYLGIDSLSVAQGVVCEFQYVWIALVVFLLINRRKPSLLIIAIVVIVLAGSFLGSGLADELLGDSDVPMNLKGILLGLASGAAYGICINLNSSIAQEMPAPKRSFIMVAAGFVVLFLFSLTQGEAPTAFAQAWGPGIILCLCMNAFPLSLFAVAYRGLNSSIVAILVAVELPVAVLTGHFILGETITPLMVAGIVLTIVGVCLTRRARD